MANCFSMGTVRGSVLPLLLLFLLLPPLQGRDVGGLSAAVQLSGPRLAYNTHSFLFKFTLPE